MGDTERIIARWISGLAAPSSSGVDEIVGRTVVVDSDDWIPMLLSSGMIDARVALIHRGSHAGAAGAGSHQTYAGTFTDPAQDLVFADGFRMRQTRYGLAEFSCFDAPTALVLVDEHDFSAFLRDADNAWHSGDFANHSTHPLAVLANVTALGGTPDQAGPEHRVFVTADGSISTSPFGATLGTAQDDPAVVTQRWHGSHQVDPTDSVALARVLPSIDRSEALHERPWLARYFEVVTVLRAIRVEHFSPGRVSGFGGRIGQVRRPQGPDAAGAPVLVEVGEGVRAVDPASGRWVVLDRTQLQQVEDLLDEIVSSGPETAMLADVFGLGRLSVAWAVLDSGQAVNR